jgi:6-phosphogluconolactonase
MNQFYLSCSLALVVVLAVSTMTRANGEPSEILFIGTYTRGTESRGIYVFEFDEATGKLSQRSVASGIENPSFLALDPSGKNLYSADEVDEFEGEHSGAVSAWSIDPKSSELTLMNRRSSGGGGPCHVAVHPNGRYLLVANYGGGTVASLPIGEDGRLGRAAAVIQHHGSSVNAERQSSPHPHELAVSPDGKYVFVPDLGLDQIVQYRFDETSGGLTANSPAFVKVAGGAGPRHLAFNPAGDRAYVVNELDLTVNAFDYDKSRGVLMPMDVVSMVGEDANRAGVSGAEIAVHPNGKYICASLRGLDQIVVFAVDQSTGRLTLVDRGSTGGKTPRNFALAPSGKWLLAANQGSGSVVVFRIGEDGKLKANGDEASVPAAVCLVFRKT